MSKVLQRHALRPIAFLSVLSACVATLIPPAAGLEQTYSTDPVWSSVEPTSTAGLALGDVDGDGDLDLVCGNMGRGNTLYLNEAGIFSTSASWSSALERPTRGIALGDVDGDGDLDLVCGNWQTSSTLYLNEGGSFSDNVAWESDSLNTTCMALGDVDGDGDLDLVRGTDGHANMLYLNDGGVFPAHPAWSSDSLDFTESIALGDVDGDGDLDLVCGNAGQPNTLYLNEGGTFSAGPVWWSSPEMRTTSIALGDVDGDGDLDLVCGNHTEVTTLYSNSGGIFLADPAWSSESAGEIHGVSLGDVDGDGDLDLVCGDLLGSNRLYLNSGGSFPSSPDWLSGPENLTLTVVQGDIDGDGDLDLVCGNSGGEGGSNTMYRNIVPAIKATPDWSSAPPKNTSCISLGDVDGDGDLDLVCGNRGYSNTFYLNDQGRLSSNPIWQSEVVFQTEGIALGDVNGDGNPDLVCGNWSKRNKAYLNEGGTFAARPAWSSDLANMTTSVVLGDLDGDGDLDLVCGNTGETGHDKSNNVYLSDGGLLATSPGWSSGEQNHTESVALGDVDSDGDLDLVCGNSPGNNTLYLNDGGVLSQMPAWRSNPANNTMSIVLGDVDGDGDLDLICGNYGQKNMLYSNEGGIFLASATWRSGPPNRTEAVALSDIDGDGDLDLVCGNYGENNTLYMNMGGVFPETPVWMSGPVDITQGIAVSDVDGDGDPDLVCGNNGANALHGGARNPVFQGDPTRPTNQLPNNSAFLSSVSTDKRETNIYEISARAMDVESDPIWILPEYQFEGAPVWHPADIRGYGAAVGPLETSPEGTIHLFDWNVSQLPFDSRGVVLRLRTISTPLRVSSIQHISSYHKEVGHIEPRRPMIASSTDMLSFPTVTVGDTVSLHIRISNMGNEILTIGSVGLPSGEMTCDLATPRSINPLDSIDVGIFLQPRTEMAIAGSLHIESNDPVTPEARIRIETDIRALDVESRLLISAPEVPLGEALTALVTPAPNVHVERGLLYHRPANRETFLDSVPLSPWADGFIAVIPGEGITEAGLEYYVKVENSGLSATEPPGAPGDSVFYQAVASPDRMTVTPHPSSGSDFLEGRDITVLISLPDGTQFVDGNLYLRMGGESAFRAVTVRDEEPLPVAVIPDSLVGARGLEYWADVRTLTTSLTYPAINPDSSPARINVTVVDLSEDKVSPAKEYRMVTVPLDFGPDFTGTLETLLSDQAAFGPYDPARWRSFRYLASLGDYVELSETYGEEFEPVPGRAFWLICSGESRVSTAPVRGLSTATDSMYSVGLEPGWNQVGNPFVFPVAWDSLFIDAAPMAEAESVIVEPPVRWVVDEGYTHGVEILEPFEGYWLKNLSDEPAVLRIPPREAPAQAIQVSPVPATLARAASTRKEGWMMKITASCEGAVDFGNYLGVRPGAAAEWDRHDRSEPPMNPGRAMSLYFPHQAWTEHPGTYTSDIRADQASGAGQLSITPADEGSRGWLWRFDVAKRFSQNSMGDRVVLQFTGQEGAPPGAMVFLLDRHLPAMTDLRDEKRYAFHLGVKGEVTEDEDRFLLLVGSEEFINEHKHDLPSLPPRTVLNPGSPNPFSAATVIRYDLAHGGRIRLSIYNATGAMVRVLYQGHREPGRYEAAWTGDTENGHRAATGLYFCRLETTAGFAATRKILLIK